MLEDVCAVIPAGSGQEAAVPGDSPTVQPAWTDLAHFAPCPAFGVQFALDAAGPLWTLTYRIRGPIQALDLSLDLPPGRRDGLWEHTCLELFASSPDGPGYVELNMSVSGAWNAYRFDAYREGMRPLENAVAPVPTIRDVGTDRALLCFEVDIASLGLRPTLDLGPAVVLEHADGSLSYWATSHPAGRPDFHAPSNRSLSITG